MPLALVALLLGGLGFTLTRGGDNAVIATPNPSSDPAPTVLTGVGGVPLGPPVSTPAFGDLAVAVVLSDVTVEGESLVMPLKLQNRLEVTPVYVGEMRYTLGGGDTVAGSDRLAVQMVEPGTSSVVELVFSGAAGIDVNGATLTIDAPGKQPLQIVLADGSNSSSLPRELTTPGEATFTSPSATLTYVIDEAVLSLDRRIEVGAAGQSAADRRADLGTAFLSLSLKLTANACECPGGVNWDSGQLRLLVNGVGVAPWTSASGVVRAGTTENLEAGFIVPADAKQVILQAGDPSSTDPAGQIVIDLR